MKTPTLALVLAFAAAMPAGAEMAMTPADASPSTEAFKDADAAMHDSMMIEYSGDPDIDFARGMIPHHQGAIAMAKIELEYGKDPTLRALAGEIITAQESEIGVLQDWLEAHEK